MSFDGQTLTLFGFVDLCLSILAETGFFDFFREMTREAMRMEESLAETAVRDSRGGGTFDDKRIHNVEISNVDEDRIHANTNTNTNTNTNSNSNSNINIQTTQTTPSFAIPSPDCGEKGDMLPGGMRGSVFLSHPDREDMNQRSRSLRSFMGDRWYHRLSRWLSPIVDFLPPLDFITIHYTYFIITLLITSLIFWGSSNPSRSISYVDALFLVTSAMTEAGLNTVDLSTMTTFQQIILWLLIIVGSAIFVSVATVRTRKRAFEVRFGEVVGRQKEQMRRCRSASRGGAESRRQHGNGSGMGSGVGENINEDAVQLEDGLKNQSVGGKGDEDGITATSEILSHGEVPKDTGDHITFAPVAHPANDKKEKNITIGNSNNQSTTPDRSGTPQLPTTPQEKNILKHRMHHKNTPVDPPQLGQQDLTPLQYPSYLNADTTGRNGQIHGLSRNEREHLGGVEYRAISFLAWLVPAYFILWQVLGGIGLGAYMAYNKSNVALENGINPWWLGLFNAISAFNNSGMSLLDSNMVGLSFYLHSHFPRIYN